MIDENAYLGDCDNAYDCQLFKEGCHNCKGQNFDINYQDFNGRWTAEGCRNLAIAKEKGYSSISNICFVAPQWVVERAEQSYLLKGRKFYVVDEYVNNNDIFVPRPVEEEKWLSLGIDTSKILILNVARFSNTRKGVRFYLDLARSMEDDDRYQFINVGFDGDRDEIPQNYVGIPFVSDQKELAEFYTLADLFMITSLSDTMPNACLEALSCGTPICGFDTTGIPYVAEYPLGQYVEPKNVEQLKQVVLSTNKKDEKMSKKCREYAMERFSPEVSGKNMLKIYNEMLTNQSKL
jgi:glycosyltransferase involved in cell wall biosynthesis